MQIKLFKRRDHSVSEFLQVKVASSRKDPSSLREHLPEEGKDAKGGPYLPDPEQKAKVADPCSHLATSKPPPNYLCKWDKCPSLSPP